MHQENHPFTVRASGNGKHYSGKSLMLGRMLHLRVRCVYVLHTLPPPVQVLWVKWRCHWSSANNKTIIRDTICLTLISVMYSGEKPQYYLSTAKLIEKQPVFQLTTQQLHACIYLVETSSGGSRGGCNRRTPPLNFDWLCFCLFHFFIRMLENKPHSMRDHLTILNDRTCIRKTMFSQFVLPGVENITQENH